MHYPAFLDLTNKRCLVIGGGKVAERKIRVLLKAGARVHCFSDTFSPGILKLAKKRLVSVTLKKLAKRPLSSSQLKNIFLVIGATSSPLLNRKVYEACRQRNILVNSVDDPQHSNFIAPAVMNRGPLAIAISTGGASPQLAKTVRERMEQLFGHEYASFLKFMSKERRKIISLVKDTRQRKKVFQDLVTSGILNLFRNGNKRAIRKRYEAVLLKHGIRKESLR